MIPSMTSTLGGEFAIFDSSIMQIYHIHKGNRSIMKQIPIVAFHKIPIIELLQTPFTF